MDSDAATRHLRSASAAAQARWQVRLLGTVEASDGLQTLQHFPTRAVAALLARVAMAPQRAHAREELIELLWPGVALAVGRNRLRQALSTLKSLLEPAGQPGGAVLLADRLAVRAAPGALACDVPAFEALLREGRGEAARALYRGELMPGYYDEWIHAERQRLAALHEALPATPAPAAPRRPAATEPAASPAPSLPSYLTRLFGADLAAARLRAQVLSRRLVTLLGPGGSGKTRLAVEVAQSLRPEPAWPAPGAPASFERVAFVPLVACEDQAQALGALARSLQLPGAADSVAALAQAIAGQRMLLVLDNFEQLVGRAEAAVGELLSLCPALHLLVTSRRALGLDGEQLLGAEPLPLPATGATLAAAAANPAVALFVDRARAVRADFHLGERNHAAITALVRVLQGMPLAIELAASRARSFPPADMAAMLTAADSGAHLVLLARGGPRAGHDPRHASMAQVIAWSWRLLDAPAQRVMAALALFPTDASASAVASVVDEPLAQAAARLDELVGHSLLRVAAQGGDAAPRFSLGEPVREFVGAQTADAERAALGARLRGWVLRWAEGLGTTVPPAQVAPELPLVHALLSAAVDPAQSLRLAWALRSYWETDGLPGRVLEGLERALQALPAAESALRADAHELLAYLLVTAGYAAAARDHADAALVAAGAEPARRARALVRRAWVDIAGSRGGTGAGPPADRWLAALAEARTLAEACGDRDALARVLTQQANLVRQLHDDWAGAEALHAQAQALWLALGDRRRAQARARSRAQCWVHLQRADEAIACFERSEVTARDEGDFLGQIDSLVSLAEALEQQRRWAAALDASRRCVALCWQRWHRHGLAYALWSPPRLLARLRQPEPALLLMAHAARLWSESFGTLSQPDQRKVARVRRLGVAQLGAARAQGLWDEGQTLDTATAVALVMRGR
jgi:predicted ATPase